MSDEKRIRNINFWHFILFAFIVVWVGGAYLYLDNKTEIISNHPSLIVIGEPSSINLTNFFQFNSSNPPSHLLNSLVKQPFITKPEYHPGDIVVVKFFYVEAIVIEKSSPARDDYEIMYKDHNHVLQKISLPKEMLMYPSEGVLNPVSLLVD